MYKGRNLLFRKTFFQCRIYNKTIVISNQWPKSAPINHIINQSQGCRKYHELDFNNYFEAAMRTNYCGKHCVLLFSKQLPVSICMSFWVWVTFHWMTIFVSSHPIEPPWTTTDPYGPCEPYGPLLTPLHPYGPLWTHMDQYGPLLTRVPYGPIWNSYGPFGPPFVS